MKSQLMLLLRAMSGHAAAGVSVDIYGSPLETVGDIPGLGSHLDHVDAQGLCRTGLALHWLWHCGELVPPLTGDST